MRAAPAVRTAATFAWRNILLAILVVLTAMVGLALLSEAMSEGDGTVYLANFSSSSQIGPNGPSIIVTGTGRASAPAEQAKMQLLVNNSEQYYPGMNTEPDLEATPGNEERARVEPILQAMEEQGVPGDTVQVVVSPATTGPCYNGPIESCFGARLDFTVDEPTVEKLDALVDAVNAAAPEVGLRLTYIGASYVTSDCAPLQRQARELATEDARRRAEQQAEVLGVELGDLLLSSEVPPAATVGGCGTPLKERPPALYDPYGRDLTGMAEAFDPAVPAEAVAVVQVNLAYAIPQVETDA